MKGITSCGLVMMTHAKLNTGATVKTTPNNPVKPVTQITASGDRNACSSRDADPDIPAKKAEIFGGVNQHRADVEDPDTVNHLNWYETTGFTVPYPGESTVRPASNFNRAAPTADRDDD